MRRRVSVCLGALLMMGGAAFIASESRASDTGIRGVAPPSVYPSNTWQGRSEAVLRVMSRLDSRVVYVTAPVGQTVSFRTLSIRALTCLQRPITLPADSAAQLHIEETQAKDLPVFEGWMLANTPSLGVYINPLYDVQLVGCQGDNVPPNPGPLPHTEAPVISVVAPPHVDADNVHSSAVPAGSGSGGPMSLLPAPQPSSPSPPPSDGSAPSPDTSGAMPLVPPSSP